MEVLESYNPAALNPPDMETIEETLTDKPIDLERAANRRGAGWYQGFKKSGRINIYIWGVPSYYERHPRLMKHIEKYCRRGQSIVGEA